MENKTVCPNCGAENKSDYAYCLNCGLALSASSPASAVTVAPASQTDGFADSFEGISGEEMAAFIGKGNRDYLTKFAKMKNGKKASWNWAVFLFGLLLGLPFVWFFYRKMYKVGSIVLAGWLAFTVASAALISPFFNGMWSIMSDTVLSYSQSESGWEDDFPGNFNPDEWEEFFEQQFGGEGGFVPSDFEPIPDDGFYRNDPSEEEITQDVFGRILALIQKNLDNFLWVSFLNTLQLAALIVLSIFADSLYKKHCVTKIADLHRNNPVLIAEVVTSAGGVNTASAVLIGIGFAVLSATVGLAAVFSGFSAYLNTVLSTFSY